MKLRTLIERDNVRADVRWTDHNQHMDCQDWPARHYVVTLKRQRRQMAVPFSCGLGIEGEPTAAGVLDCLLWDYHTADNAFEDWCAQHVLSPGWVVMIVDLSRGFLWQFGGSSELHVFLPFAARSREALSGARCKPSQPLLT